MEERRRVALVEAAGQGSGYVLGPRLVLTAGHVLGALDHAAVRTPGGAPVRCEVVWARSDAPYDAALLLADDDLVPDPDPVRWGTLVTSDPSEVTVLGFSALAGREGRVGSGVFRGSADPLEAVETDRYVLDMTGNPPLGPADGSPWAGMSGGAVWCHGVLVGVAVADLPGWPHSRLEAVPAYALLADASFRELIRRHTERGVQLEPAEFADGAEAAAPLVPRSVASLLHPVPRPCGSPGAASCSPRWPRGVLRATTYRWPCSPGLAGPGSPGSPVNWGTGSLRQGTRSCI